jgi:FkbM family methyltransferase
VPVAPIQPSPSQKNTVPIAATPAALAICAVVPYMPAPAPALTGFTVASTALDSGAISGLVPRGALVIDVGANVGFFSLRFADWVGDAGKVIAIELEQRNYAQLVAAIDRQGHARRVATLKAVAADEPRQTFLEINALQPADHKISRNGTGMPVDAVTTTSWCRTRQSRARRW